MIMMRAARAVLINRLVAPHGLRGGSLPGRSRTGASVYQSDPGYSE